MKHTQIMDLKSIIKLTIVQFRSEYFCGMQWNRVGGVTFNSMPQKMGSYWSPGPSWFVFGLDKSDDEPGELCARAESVVGRLISNECLGRALQYHYVNSAPVYSVHCVDEVPFIFLVSEIKIPLAMGGIFVSALLRERLVKFIVSDDLPGIERSLDTLNRTLISHTPKAWDLEEITEIINLAELFSDQPPDSFAPTRISFK